MSAARRSIATTEGDRARGFADAVSAGVGIVALHHVQLAMPEGGEEAARAFYAGVLGLTEVPKPEILHGRGGVWFTVGNVRVHLGVETPFAPAQKAHPAFAVASLAAAIRHLEVSGTATIRDVDLPDLRRIYVADPFGNRIELAEPVA